jgi:hypothetical protein
MAVSIQIHHDKSNIEDFEYRVTIDPQSPQKFPLYINTASLAKNRFKPSSIDSNVVTIFNTRDDNGAIYHWAT